MSTAIPHNRMGAVGEQDFLRRAAAVLHLDEIEIAENGVNYERDRQHERMVTGRFWAEEGVERVCHNRRTGDNSNELVEQGDGVTIENFSVGTGALVQ
jgi:hypothetical protein